MALANGVDMGECVFGISVAQNQTIREVLSLHPKLQVPGCVECSATGRESSSHVLTESQSECGSTRDWPIAQAPGKFPVRRRWPRQNFWRRQVQLLTNTGGLRSATFVSRRVFVLCPRRYHSFFLHRHHVSHSTPVDAPRAARYAADGGFRFSAARFDSPRKQEGHLEGHRRAMGSRRGRRLLLQHQPHLCR